jgi:hypothetical protein
MLNYSLYVLYKKPPCFDKFILCFSPQASQTQLGTDRFSLTLNLASDSISKYLKIKEADMKFPWFIWIPRILLIATILFMAMFSGDIFDMKVSFWQKMLGLLMHNIMPPTIPMALLLIFTWKRPLWGGIILAVITLGFAYVITTRFQRYIVFDLLVFILPLLICSGLFIASHFCRRKPEKPAPQTSDQADEN